MFGGLSWGFSARSKYLHVESHCIAWQANVIFPSQSPLCCSPMTLNDWSAMMDLHCM